MNIRRKALTMAAAAAVAIGGLSLGAATPAFAINRAFPCNPADTGNFLEFYGESSTCFANAGGVGVRIYAVNEAQSGNNAGYFITSDNNGTVYYFNKWDFVFPHNDSSTVTFIFIS
jgi:hypothetical protein